MGPKLESGDIIEPEYKTLSGQGKPQSDQSSVLHIQYLLQHLGIMQLHAPSNSHLGTPSRIMHHALPPIMTSLFVVFRLHLTSVH